jgi:transposase
VADIDPRDERIAELEAQLAAAHAVNAQLTKRVAELEARLNQNSTNSSKPPSSDPPGAPRKATTPTGRKPGGQPGHKHHKRELIPAEQVTSVVELIPERCRGCKAPLAGTDGDPERHQTVEVPPITPVITEYRCHALTCKCGVTTRADLPDEAAHVFGERLTAVIGLLSGKYRLSKRLVQSALSDLLGVDLALGTVSNRDMEVSASLAAPMVEAEQAVRETDGAHMDETGWYEGKADGRSKRAWLWVVVTACITVFRISRSRGSEVAKAMLGEGYTGFLTTDRWCGYNWFDLTLRQLCWSHLTRDWQSFIDRGGESARIGLLLMADRNRMFRWWRRVRDGTMDRAGFERRMKRVRRRVGRLLRDAEVCPDAKTAGMAKEILKLESGMWTFVDVPGLEPTNNIAERTIRHGVMYRKTSFGTQSPEGSRFVERVLTTVATLKQQNRNVLEFLTEAVRAYRRELTPPSLLPSEAAGQLALAA